MKKSIKYVFSSIIMLLILGFLIVVLNDNNIKKDNIFVEVIIAFIIEISGFKFIKWLLKQKIPTNILLCTAVTMLMITPISFAVWLLTYEITDFFLEITIITFSLSIITMLASLIISLIIHIKEKIMFKKNRQ